MPFDWPYMSACMQHVADPQWPTEHAWGLRRSFRKYLADMGSLVLMLEDSFSGMLGEAAVRVADLAEASPLAGEVAFVQVLETSLHAQARRRVKDLEVFPCISKSDMHTCAPALQWLGHNEEVVVARLSLQLLLSFTPATEQPTLATRVPLFTSVAEPEEASLERRFSQEGASSSGRHSRTPQRPRSAPTAFRGGDNPWQPQEKPFAAEHAAVHPSEAALDHWSGSSRQSIPLPSIPGHAEHVPLQAEPFSLQGCTGHLCDQPEGPGVQPYTVPHFSGLAGPLPYPAVAGWAWEAGAAGQFGQQTVAQGIPVIPLSALEPVLDALGSALEPRRQPPAAQSSPDQAAGPEETPLNALIRQAERLREAMSAAIGPPRHGAGPGITLLPCTSPRQQRSDSGVAQRSSSSPGQPKGAPAPAAANGGAAGRAAPQGANGAHGRDRKEQRASLGALKRPKSAPGVAFGSSASLSKETCAPAPEQEVSTQRGTPARAFSGGMRLLAERRAARAGRAAAAVAAQSAAAAARPASHALEAGKPDAAAPGTEVAVRAPEAAVPLLAVQHAFEVTVDRVTGLSAAAEGPYFISYQFPGAPLCWKPTSTSDGPTRQCHAHPLAWRPQ